jgi:HK97 family phage portal protein
VSRPAQWDGWPADWSTAWGSPPTVLTDTAWTCLDLNASVLATMPPYLVGAASTLDADWLTNPNPALYTSWEEFAKQLAWDFQLGEAFVIADAYYATGWPARFHVVPPWSIKPDIDRNGLRRYMIGELDVTADVLHVRYKSTVGDARGHGPLEVGAARLVAADLIARYAASLPAAGGIPASVLEHPDELSPEQAAELRNQWVLARQSALGEPAVMSGGVVWKATQVNPRDMALLELETHNESRIAVMLGVPPFLVGLPSGGDSMTYSNVSSIFDYHWRAGLRPKAQTLMAALSGWALPRGTTVEVNRDAYVQPDPYTRAQTAQILHGIVDEQTKQPALTVAEIRATERFDGATPEAPAGVMRG